MATKSEAAEALYRAALEWKRSGWTLQMSQAVRAALDAYSTATPDALPAEVARVVEAAVKYTATFGHALRAGSYGAEGELLALAVAAYRSSFPAPEPLSARLARLGKGTRVRLKLGHCGTVEANAPQHERLWLAVDGNKQFPMMTCTYTDIDSILSEVA